METLSRKNVNFSVETSKFKDVRLEKNKRIQVSRNILQEMLALLASYNEPLYQSLFDVSVAQVGDLRSEKKNLSTYWNSFIP